MVVLDPVAKMLLPYFTIMLIAMYTVSFLLFLLAALRESERPLIGIIDLKVYKRRYMIETALREALARSDYYDDEY